MSPADQWVARLAEIHDTGRLQDELRHLARYPLLAVDEVGYIRFEHEAGNFSSNSSHPSTNVPA